MNDEQQAAVEQIRRLMTEHHLSVAEIVDAVSMDEPVVESDPDARSALLTRVLSYIGGAFVFSGIAAFVALQWGEMNSVARVVITLGSGLALFILALSALHDSRFRNATVPLLLGAAALEPVGLMVAFDEFGGGGDAQVAAMLTAGTVAMQFILGFLRYQRTTMMFVGVFFASACWGLVLDLLDFEWQLAALTSGVAWLLLGVHFHRGLHAPTAPPLFFFGCWAFLSGLFEMLEDRPYEILFLAAACSMTWLGVWARSRALNFASTVAILAYTAYFTGRHFADSIGWPIALIMIGLLMIGISALALKIDRRYLRST